MPSPERPTALSTRLGLVTIPASDRPAGYTYLEAWEEAAGRICVAFALDRWEDDAPEFDFFGSWAEAYAAHPALAQELIERQKGQAAMPEQTTIFDQIKDANAELATATLIYTRLHLDWSSEAHGLAVAARTSPGDEIMARTNAVYLAAQAAYAAYCAVTHAEAVLTGLRTLAGTNRPAAD
jgi:hypothetical protein